MKYILLTSVFISAIYFPSSSQSSPETKEPDTSLIISGYLEPYYSFDFANPANHVKPDFIYAYNRHNEINLHLGLVKAAYIKSKIRANLGIMTGTYSNANLFAEPGVLKNIYEANTGVKISRKKQLWIDAGIFPSHIGFEGVIGKDCWTLTRSIQAENSPYYESGIKISYTTENGKLFFSGLLLNGWQRIQRVDGNQVPSFGHQLTYKPNSRITLNSSSFVGTDKPDSLKQIRFFHNLYGILQVSNRFAVTLGFDIGSEKVSESITQYHAWYSPVLIFKINSCDNIDIAIRVEYYKDKNGVIIKTETPNGFQVFGYSLNVDYVIDKNIVWRSEVRGFSSKDKIYVLHKFPSNQNYVVTSSLALLF